MDSLHYKPVFVLRSGYCQKDAQQLQRKGHLSVGANRNASHCVTVLQLCIDFTRQQLEQSVCKAPHKALCGAGGALQQEEVLTRET